MPPKKYNAPFGKLEGEIMNIIWKADSATVREVLAFLRTKRKRAYTTVMTVMARLYEKGVLKRSQDISGAFVYRPKKEKLEFFQDTSKKLISSLIKEYGDVAVAQFIDIIESSNAKKRKEWRKKLKKII